MMSVTVSGSLASAEDDHQLLRRIAKGEHAAFALLARRHTTRFYRVAYRFLRDRDYAQDIVQDAFLKLWEKPSLWQDGKNTAFTTWFYRIIVNQCIDHKRKKRPLQLVDDTWIEDERVTSEDTLLHEEKNRLLVQQIDLLPGRQKAALILCFYEGLSNQEAAEIMGVHLKALQSLLMRAKTTLKEQLRYMLEV